MKPSMYTGCRISGARTRAKPVKGCEFNCGLNSSSEVLRRYRQIGGFVLILQAKTVFPRPPFHGSSDSLEQDLQPSQRRVELSPPLSTRLS